MRKFFFAFFLLLVFLVYYAPNGFAVEDLLLFGGCAQNLGYYSTTYYYGCEGTYAYSVEARVQQPLMLDVNLTWFAVNVDTNTFDGAVNISFRDDGVSTSCFVVVPAATTGVFYWSGSVPIANGSLISLRAVESSSSGSFYFSHMGWFSIDLSVPGGDGDMTKAVYDTDNDNVVDNSEKLNSHTEAQVQDHVPNEHGNECHDPDFCSSCEGGSTDIVQKREIILVAIIGAVIAVGLAAKIKGAF